MKSAKVTFVMTGQAREALEAVSYAEALPNQDIINRAIILYSAMAATQEGRLVTIKNSDDSTYVVAAIVAKD